jgi:hypothetical protein
MKTTFYIQYKQLIGEMKGLMFERRIEVQYPTDLARYDDPITRVTEDSRGYLKVETSQRVYLQEGYMEASHESA